jgi:hypothetical protein
MSDILLEYFWSTFGWIIDVEPLDTEGWLYLPITHPNLKCTRKGAGDGSSGSLPA